MRKIIFHIILSLIPVSLCAQEYWLSSHAFSSGGNFQASGAYNLTSTIGESFIFLADSTDADDPQATLIGGFQQNLLEDTKGEIQKMERTEALSFDVSTFPNPVTDYVNVKINDDLHSDVTIEVINSIGQILKVVYVDESIQLETARIDLSNIQTKGFYIIHIASTNKLYAKVIKLAVIHGK